MKTAILTAMVVMALLASTWTAPALDNGLGLTPPMGYNTWYANGTGGSNEKLLLVAADSLATNGMLAAGYNYINLDAGWAAGRDTNGDIYPDSTNFPHGMKYVADYVHAKGMKFGIWCSFAVGNGPVGALGSGGHIAQDAGTFAAWGIDYIKADGNPEATFQTDTETFLGGITNAGRPMFVNLSIGNYEPWMQTDANSWRGTGDFNGTYSNMFHAIDFVSLTPAAAGPGHWNDPDVIGNAQYYSAYNLKTQFGMWSILAAPLIVDGIPGYDAASYGLLILTNAEVIAVDQDAAGVQGTLVATNPDGWGQVWSRPLSGTNAGAIAVCLLNRNLTNSETITVPWSAIGQPEGAATVRDLFQYADLGYFTNAYTAVIQPGDVQLLTLVPGSAPFLRAGTNYLSDLHYFAYWTNETLGSTPPNFLPPGMDLSSAGNPITINGVVYKKGIGAHAVSHLQYGLGGLADRFQSVVGVDDEKYDQTHVDFQVRLDDLLVFDSGAMTNGSPSQVVDVSTAGARVLTLDVLAANPGGGNINDHADWAGARVQVHAAPVISCSIAWNAGNLVIAGNGGGSGANCFLLASTNLNTPAAQWTVMATNQFDGSGSLTFTNPVNQNAVPMFYRLQSP